MILIVRFPDRIESRNARGLVSWRVLHERAALRAFEVDPKPTHRVVHRRKHAHGVRVRVFGRELLVDLEHAGELLLELCAWKMGDVEINLELVLLRARVVDAAVLVKALLEESAA